MADVSLSIHFSPPYENTQTNLWFSTLHADTNTLARPRPHLHKSKHKRQHIIVGGNQRFPSKPMVVFMGLFLSFTLCSVKQMMVVGCFSVRDLRIFTCVSWAFLCTTMVFESRIMKCAAVAHKYVSMNKFGVVAFMLINSYFYDLCSFTFRFQLHVFQGALLLLLHEKRGSGRWKGYKD